MKRDEISEEVNRRLRGYERKNYDYTEARYRLRSMRYYANLRSAIISCLVKRKFRKHPNPKVLDIGCGTGVLLKDLYRLNDTYSYVGLDFSHQMLHKNVLSDDEREKITLIRGSAFDLPFKDSSFDVVVCTRFIHQYSDNLKRQLIQEFRRVLKDNGIAIIEFYSIGPWILRYPLKFRKTNWHEYFNHCVSGRRLERILGTTFRKLPLILPFHTAIVKLSSFPTFIMINRLFGKLRLHFLFEQFLVVIVKSKNQIK